MRLASAKRDVAVFAERVLRRPLWPHQLEAAGSDAFITVIAKARRTGGTTLVETLAAWACFRERNVKAVILSASQEASRRVTEDLGAVLATSDLASGSVVDDFATRIRLTNGSEILSLPASQRAVRGLGKGVKLLVVDEAGFVAEELWRAASYVALDERRHGGRILLVGTPWGGPDAFFRRAFEAGRDGDPDHASHHWTFDVNPNLDRAYLERQRDRVSPPEYAAEVLGEWSDAAGALIPRALIDAAVADVEAPARLADLAPPARPIIGLDWGVSFDRSAAAVVYRLPIGDLNPDHERRPRFIVWPFVWPAGHPMIGDAQRPGVVHEVAAASAPFAYVATETSGVGAGPSEELVRRIRGRPGGRRWNLIPTTAARKTAGYGVILGLLERGQLVLPRHPDLLRQLAGLRFEQGRRGFVHIEAESDVVHDDVADAVMLSTGPEARHNGRILCRLAHLAAGRLPDAPVPPLDLPMVQTGGGLRLPRAPVVQSVDGFELTYPDGAAAPAPPEPAWAASARSNLRALRAREAALAAEEV